MKNIAIAHESHYYRNNISGILEGKREFNLAFAAEEFEELFCLLSVHSIDILLVEGSMAGKSAVHTIRQIRTDYPSTKIIALSEESEISKILAIYGEGANSLVSRSELLEEIYRSIRSVMSGGVYVTRNTAVMLRKFFSSSKADKLITEDLSDVERTLLKGICDGMSSTGLGHLIHKSPRTVEKYREKLYQKFQVRRKEELIAKASQLGITSMVY